MNKTLDFTKFKKIRAQINIPGSKSIANRALILQAFLPHLIIKNLPSAEDTRVLQKALTSKKEVIDIGHAGTAMRFLTAYFAIQANKNVLLTGSLRMQERPIKILVNALQELGAKIEYVNKTGFPPLHIYGQEITNNKVQIQANVSSQYISALLLIAPFLVNGLEIELVGELTSKPYVDMTLNLLQQVGVKTSYQNNIIKILNYRSQPLLSQGANLKLEIEPDWSSASYFYSLVALHPDAQIHLEGFKPESLQGDRILTELYKDLGVKSEFTETGLSLSKQKFEQKELLHYDLVNNPDLAQTIAVTCLGLRQACHLTGLHTLKIKETDRLQALKNELEKFGAVVKITNDSLFLTPSKKLPKNIKIATYQDHRMAMAFAALSVLTPIEIQNAKVVRKSYPGFWKDFEEIL